MNRAIMAALLLALCSCETATECAATCADAGMWVAQFTPGAVGTNCRCTNVPVVVPAGGR